MEFRNAYERDQHKGITFNEPTMTQQQFKDECDVNVIIDRYTSTGVIPEELVNASAGVYGDFSGVGDYMEMQNRLIAARESFDSLPSSIRSRFNDNPAELIAFVSDGNNYDEAVKLGIVSPRSAALERENADKSESN